MKTAQEWEFILDKCAVNPSIAKTWAQVFVDNITEDTFRSDEDLTAFLGQVLHESGLLLHLEENLNYSAERLMAVWPKRFPDLDTATQYAHNPKALAEKVYGGRLGNDEAGDGAKYIGRGLIALTGKANYRTAGDDICVDLINSPELLAQPKYALLSAIAWWKRNIGDDIVSDHEAVTRKVNGGLIGFVDRERLTNLADNAIA